MMRLANRDMARIREIEGVLGRLPSDGSDTSLQDAVTGLRDLCGAHTALLYTLTPRGHGLHVGTLFGSGLAPRFRDLFNEYLADKLVGWTGFNPLSPEPAQRNMPMDETEIHRRVGGTRPAERDLYPRVGMGGYGTSRVLLCEGPQLLAYLGMFDPASSVPRSKHILRRLTRAFQRRMRIDHLLRVDSPLASALDVALEQIGRPTFLLSDRGQVLAANELAQQELSRDATTARERLLEAVRRAADTEWFRITPVVTRGAADAYLAVERPRVAEMVARVEQNSEWLGLSPRQREIAKLLCVGCSNRAIAVRLRIAERTVEAHLTLMYEKTGAESRASLVALLLR